MRLIWSIIKLAAGDIWDEMLHLLVFNAIWLLGSLLILPWPYLTFGLFFTAYDISQGKAIKLNSLFVRPAPFWKQAYVWGAVNLLAALLFRFNLNFYNNFATTWAATIQIVFVALLLLWSIWQLLALPMYPRLEKPGLRLALRNAAIVMGRYPLAVLVLVVIVTLLLLITAILPMFAFFGAGALIVVLCNRLVGTIVERELARGAESE
jgi:uncharacterized membrane protein YesL